MVLRDSWQHAMVGVDTIIHDTYGDGYIARVFLIPVMVATPLFMASAIVHAQTSADRLDACGDIGGFNEAQAFLWAAVAVGSVLIVLTDLSACCFANPNRHFLKDAREGRQHAGAGDAAAGLAPARGYGGVTDAERMRLERIDRAGANACGRYTAQAALYLLAAVCVAQVVYAIAACTWLAGDAGTLCKADASGADAGVYRMAIANVVIIMFFIALPLTCGVLEKLIDGVRDCVRG